MWRARASEIFCGPYACRRAIEEIALEGGQQKYVLKIIHAHQKLLIVDEREEHNLHGRACCYGEESKVAHHLPRNGIVCNIAVEMHVAVGPCRRRSLERSGRGFFVGEVRCARAALLALAATRAAACVRKLNLDGLLALGAGKMYQK